MKYSTALIIAAAAIALYFIFGRQASASTVPIGSISATGYTPAYRSPYSQIGAGKPVSPLSGVVSSIGAAFGRIFGSQSSASSTLTPKSALNASSGVPDQAPDIYANDYQVSNPNSSVTFTPTGVAYSAPGVGQLQPATVEQNFSSVFGSQPDINTADYYGSNIDLSGVVDTSGDVIS